MIVIAKASPIYNNYYIDRPSEFKKELIHYLIISSNSKKIQYSFDYYLKEIMEELYLIDEKIFAKKCYEGFTLEYLT